MRVFEGKIQFNLVHLGEVEKINTPDQAAAYLQSAIDTHPVQEGFYVILLDRKNHPLGRVLVTLGTLTSSLVHPREVFRPAILASAASVILAHNHPSGDPSPSAADIQVTRQLREASRAVDIEILDHVIVGSKESDPTKVGYYSFRDTGLL
jgi:DNA repair protein RadC